MEIAGFIFIILFCALVLNARLIMRSWWWHRKFPSIKQLLVWNAVVAAILVVYGLLPKSDGRCRLTIIIDNRNSQAEVVVDKRFSWNLIDDREVVMGDLVPSGFIAIRTRDAALIGAYSHPGHVFSFGHTMKIKIHDNKIKVSKSPWITLGTITDDAQTYDKVIDLFRAAR